MKRLGMSSMSFKLLLVLRILTGGNNSNYGQSSTV